MGEFWARSATHRVQDEERFFTKQPASAAHIYGKRMVLAESFTSIGPQWEEDPRSLKPVFDQAACEGLNLVMLHTYDSSPDEMGEPGQAYFAGTHINPHITWWNHADAFFGVSESLPVHAAARAAGVGRALFLRRERAELRAAQERRSGRVLPGYRLRRDECRGAR